jgi:5-methylcytosine-specific restriction endonuclease McrA
MSTARVLQIDVSGRPIGLIAWHRAAMLLWDGRATAIEVVDGQYWRSPSVSIPKSRIIQTHDYVKLRPLKDSQVIKRVLFARDKYKCAYCEKQLTRHTATIDHVKPRSRFIREGGKASDAHTYTNCVTCCAKCNTKKGDRLPYECGMMPKITPVVPSYVQVLWAGKLYCPVQAEYVSMYFKIDKDTLLARPISS